MRRTVKDDALFYKTIPLPVNGKFWKANPNCPLWIRRLVGRIQAEKLEKMYYQI